MRIRNKNDALQILEAAKKAQLGGQPKILDRAFEKQLEIIKDPVRLKAVLGTRRAGKTDAMITYLLYEASKAPHRNVIYISRDRGTAKFTVWNKLIERATELGMLDKDPNQGELIMTLPNGSRIRVDGGDSNERIYTKFVGVDWALCVLDECQYWKTNLQTIIFEGLRPAMLDVGGTIVMVGVPGPFKGFFHDVTTEACDPVTKQPLHPMWANHRLTGADNVGVREGKRMCDRFAEELKEIEERDPGQLLTSKYKNNYLGLWCDSTEGLCWPFDAKQHAVYNEDDLPGHKDEYVWTLAVDVGYSPDPMAFVVAGYRPKANDRALYFVHAHEQKEMLVDDVAAYIRREILPRWNVTRWFIDGANKNIAEEYRQRVGFPFVSAQKVEKSMHVSMMADDMLSGKIKALMPGSKTLVKEWSEIVWDRTDEQKPVPHGGFDDHCADAALYLWRMSYHHLARALQPKPFIPGPRPDSNEWARQHEKRMQERIRTKGSVQTSLQALDGFFGPRRDR